MPFQLSTFGWRDDANFPVQSALYRACIDNYNAAEAAIAKAVALRDQPGTKPAVLAEMKTAKQLFNNCRDLLGWVYPRMEPMSMREALTRTRHLEEGGSSSEFVGRIFLRLQKRDMGAPRKLETKLVVMAFELLLQSKDWSLGRVTRKLCPCGADHNTKCEQTFKAGIRALKKLLRKYAPELVLRYDVLHPDRSKKVNG